MAKSALSILSLATPRDGPTRMIIKLPLQHQNLMLLSNAWCPRESSQLTANLALLKPRTLKSLATGFTLSFNKILSILYFGGWWLFLSLHFTLCICLGFIYGLYTSKRKFYININSYWTKKCWRVLIYGLIETDKFCMPWN